MKTGNATGAVSDVRMWLTVNTDALFPRKESGLARGILF